MVGINQKILILDEGTFTEKLLLSILHKDNYDIQTHLEVKLAIKSLKTIPSSYEAIVINTNCKDINYIDFKNKVKNDPDLAGIPIIQIEKDNDINLDTKNLILSDITILKQEIMDKDDPNIFHLATPLNPSIIRPLLSTLKELNKEKRRIRSFFEGKKSGIDLIEQIKLTIKKHEEANTIADYLALYCPHFENARSGLKELLYNAIEHGNYEIGYDLKGTLLLEGTFEEELQKRIKDSKYKNRKVDILLEKRKEGIYIQITDEGKGFESKRYMEVSPSRATHNHGRGISLCYKVYFDKLAYNDKGNQVTCFMSNRKKVRENYWD
ncbi:MAG: ATP-binding protein [Bdellovibrionales bacterium]|nr:ATP-binding protein [Bdellovibrionales bacterium]